MLPLENNTKFHFTIFVDNVIVRALIKLKKIHNLREACAYNIGCLCGDMESVKAIPIPKAMHEQIIKYV